MGVKCLAYVPSSLILANHHLPVSWALYTLGEVIRPHSTQWHVIVKSVLWPLMLIVLSLLAGVHAADFNPNIFDSWFACISYTLLLLSILYEIRQKPKKRNWFINQSAITGKSTIDVWSVKLLKFWVVLSLVLFVIFFSIGHS